MAVCVPLSFLKDEHMKVIISFLTFEAKDTYFSKKETPVGFSAYKVEVHHSQKVVILPFFFGLVFCQRYGFPAIMSRYRPLEQHLIVPRISITNNMTFRDDQEIVVKEALSNLMTYRCTLLQLHPGYGKTALASYITKVISMVTLVVVHRTFLAEQFTKTFNRYTNAKLCFIDGGTIDMNADVFICMITSIHKVPNEVFAKIGLLVVDEAHCQATQIRVSGLMNLDTKYMLFLTATPNLMNGMGNVLKAFVGESRVIRKFKRPFDVYAISTNVDPVVESTGFQGKMNFDKYKKSLFYNEEMNKFVTYSVVKNQGRKILILTGEKKHVDLLGDMIGAQGLRYSKFYGSQNTHEDAPILLGSTSKISVGYDSENLATKYDGIKIDLLYLLVSYRDPNVLEQTIGRVLRSNGPAVIYFINNAGVSEAHSKVLRKWAREMPVTIHDIEKNLTPNSRDMNEVDRFLNDKNAPVIVSPSVII